jgi:hypothetical protein
VGASDAKKILKTDWSRDGLLGSENKAFKFARETMSTNKLVCQLCAEFIPATRAAKQNHRLTVSHTCTYLQFQANSERQLCAGLWG